MYKIKEKGFTLIELLVVIAIIGILAGTLFVAINPAEQNLKANDAKRLSDAKAIEQALDMYLIENGKYPNPDSTRGAGSWDIGNTENQLLEDGIGSYMPKTPNDPTETGNDYGYKYYTYSAGYRNCPVEKGRFYVFEIRFEDNNKHKLLKKNSPGFKCGDRDWSNEGAYVIGKFEH